MQPYFIGQRKLSNESQERVSVSTLDDALQRLDRHIILCCGQGGHGA
jgi:hypothetical protein